MDGDHKMEHRWSVRKPVIVDVALRRQGSAPKRYRSRNLSMEGVFVESGTDSWPEDTFLELELPLYGQRKQTRHRVPVVVVHRTDEGMGLMFCVFDQVLFKTVEYLLYESASGPYEERDMIWRGRQANTA
jgi:hypothetical protein